MNTTKLILIISLVVFLALVGLIASQYAFADRSEVNIKFSLLPLFPLFPPLPPLPPLFPPLPPLPPLPIIIPMELQPRSIYYLESSDSGVTHVFAMICTNWDGEPYYAYGAVSNPEYPTSAPRLIWSMDTTYYSWGLLEWYVFEGYSREYLTTEEKKFKITYPLDEENYKPVLTMWDIEGMETIYYDKVEFYYKYTPEESDYEYRCK